MCFFVGINCFKLLTPRTDSAFPKKTAAPWRQEVLSVMVVYNEQFLGEQQKVLKTLSGFPCGILKGSSSAAYYPLKLCCAGNIDLLLPADLAILSAGAIGCRRRAMPCPAGGYPAYRELRLQGRTLRAAALYRWTGGKLTGQFLPHRRGDLPYPLACLQGASPPPSCCLSRLPCWYCATVGRGRRENVHRFAPLPRTAAPESVRIFKRVQWVQVHRCSTYGHRIGLRLSGFPSDRR